MYRILIVENNEIPIKNVKHIKIDGFMEELKSEYDLIYIDEKYVTKQISMQIEPEYMKLPIELKKLAINGEINRTYISLQIVNKLIIDNLKIIDFKNYYEEMTIAIVIKQMLNRNNKFKQYLYQYMS